MRLASYETRMNRRYNRNPDPALYITAMEHKHQGRHQVSHLMTEPIK